MTHTTIKCKLHRVGGSKLDLYGKTYHFKPADPKADPQDKEVPHVCIIPHTEARAIYRLLSIKEAYELADPAEADSLPPKPKAEAGQTIAGDKADEGPKDVIIDNDGEQVNLSKMEAAELRTFARDTFQIKVHAKWSDQNVIQKIIEAMRADAGEA